MAIRGPEIEVFDGPRTPSYCRNLRVAIARTDPLWPAAGSPDDSLEGVGRSLF